MAQLNRKKLRSLGKLMEAGFTNEKSILDMTMEEMLSLPNITVAEMGLISGLKKAIKSNKVISYLGGEEQDG